MKLSLIEHLVCPDCKGKLRCVVYQEDNSMPWSEIVEGSLTCEFCNQAYPIYNGVPRMIAGPLPEEVQQTVSGFGWEWNTFNEQIQDTYMTDKEHFLGFIYPTTTDFFEGKVVLDAGCGMGRFLRLAAEFGSREIIGVDLSNSVDAAYHNTRNLPNAHVVQGDILALPFVRKFDYIFSVGVLHHLKSPKEGFSELVRLLKADGRISVWVYSQENNGWAIHLLSPLRRHLTSRLPKRALYALSRSLGLILYACLQLIYKPANENRLGLELGRWLPYNDYLYYNSRLSYASLVSIIFDHIFPQLAHYISKKEFESWFCEEDLSAVTITARNNMSWRGQGMRVGSVESA